MRYALLSAATAVLVACAAPAAAQAPAKTARIGVLLQLPPTADAMKPLWAAMVAGLREHGWEEGRNLVIEGRFAGQDPARFGELAAELVAMKVDVILAANLQSSGAARRQTATIPIVMMGAGGDLVRAGLVASLARPSGNVTGVTVDSEALAGKQLELLTELKPGVRRVGVLHNPAIAASGAVLKTQLEEIAPRLGIEVLPIPITTADDIEGAFAAIRRERPDALQVHAVPIVQAYRREIAAFAIAERLPTVSGLKVLVPEGLLMSYSNDTAAAFRRAGWYVDRILRGANPAELPVEQMSKFELTVNLRTARAIGLDLSTATLARIDEMIE